MTAQDLHNLSVQATELFNKDLLDQAEEKALQVVNFHPDAPLALQVLGYVDLRKGRIDSSIARLARAIQLQPDLSVAHNGLGCCYSRQGETELALHHFNRALFLQPVYPIAQFARGEMLLKRGEYEVGWVDYEHRWTSGLVRGPQIPRPRWDGSPLAGRSLLIHSEQGVGDVLMMIRLLPLLKREQCRIVFACHSPLHPLLKSNPHVDRWFPIDEPSHIDFDIYTPLLCLPLLLKLDEGTIPRTVPYVDADPVRVEKWREPITSLPGFKVGICWQGSPTFGTDQFRSIPLGEYAPLAATPGVTLVSLQKGHGEEQIAANAGRVPVQTLPDLDKDAAFVDSAAVMQHLDLIITSDTAIAHLAGCLGRPVWVMLGTGCDWRWSEDRSDSTWYPTMRLFRQKKLGEWGPVFAEVAAALAEVVAGGSKAPRVRQNLALRTPAAAGEVIDKLTILEIKSERISDPDKLANVRRELGQLRQLWDATVTPTLELATLVVELKRVNLQLWEIEDAIRLCEKADDFGEKFVGLARSVYQVNDRRSALKRQINELLGSSIVEEKAYA